MDYETVVVGAGVVGLAVAARLAPRGPLLVVERHDGPLQEASSRNSEVVHGGLYYPAGSIKARACVRGKHALYARCDRLGIAAPRIGKYVVATAEAELAGLHDLAAKAAANGVDDLRWLDRAELRREQPDVGGIGALFSPSTGIVDSHAFAASLRAEAEAHGADVAFRTTLIGVAPLPDGYALTFDAGEPVTLTARSVVNAAGLGQDAVSSLAGIDVDAAGYRTYACKGRYCSIAPRHRGRLTSLVYPVGTASGGGLGVHLCLDVGGGMRLGPDIEWVEPRPDGSYDLSVPDSVVPGFLEAGRTLMPFLEPGDLQPELAGLRAKLVPRAGQWRDFVVQEESERGLPGWLTLAGIESPGLTASLALAEFVEERLGATAAPGS